MVAVMRLPVGPHPRSHGENGMFTPPVYSFAGSSPLTRGKLDVHAARVQFRGLIPTHAGKTGSACPRQPPKRAHPRSRRENQQFLRHACAMSGSSPLTRGKQPAASGRMGASGLIPTHAGKHERSVGQPGWPGLIPAHAGKTTSPGTTPPPPRAHPRSRGENIAAAPCCGTTPGSSPLTRGKPSNMPLS